MTKTWTQNVDGHGKRLLGPDLWTFTKALLRHAAVLVLLISVLRLVKLVLGDTNVEPLRVAVEFGEWVLVLLFFVLTGYDVFDILRLRFKRGKKSGSAKKR